MKRHEKAEETPNLERFQCQLCSEEFDSLKSQNEHEKAHNDVNLNKLEIHFKEGHLEEYFKCEHCQKNSDSSTKNETSEIKTDKPCSSPYDKSIDVKELEKGQYSSKANKTYKINLKNLRINAQKQDSYKKTKLNRKTIRKNVRKQESNEKSNKLYKEIWDSIKKEEEFSCKTCQKSFKTKKSLLFHELVVECEFEPKQEIHKCFMCGKSYKNLKWLQQHENFFCKSKKL